MSDKPRNLLRLLGLALARLDRAVAQPASEFVRDNLTSRTYNDTMADTIYPHLPTYTRLIRQTLDELTRRAKE
jgi:hypothetical protein